MLVFKNAGEAVAEQIVAHVAQMEGFVGVGRRVLHHEQRRGIIRLYGAEIGSVEDGCQHGIPESGRHHYVEKTLHHIEAGHSRFVVDKPLANLGPHGFGSLAGGFDKGKYHHCEVALEFLSGGLGNNALRRGIDAVKLVHGLGHGVLYDVFY